MAEKLKEAFTKNQNLKRIEEVNEPMNLKESIQLAHDMGDEYQIDVDKYVNIELYMLHLDVSRCVVLPKANKEGIYDIKLYNCDRLVETRKGIMRNGEILVARNIRRKNKSRYNIFVYLKLFSLF
jgi:hypothetical protein